MQWSYNPSLLVLLETKIQEHKHLTEVLKFDTQKSVIEGLSRGIVIMWKEDALNLDNILMTPQRFM